MLRRRAHAGRMAAAPILVGLAIACGSSSPSAPKSRFPPSYEFANKCDDPAAKKQWVRSTLDEVYLWNDEVVDVDAGAYATPEAYYEALLVRTPTASGRPKDNWSDSTPVPTLERAVYWHGVRWSSFSSTDVQAWYVRPGTPASDAGVLRGDRVVAVAGVPVEQLTPEALSDALFPAVPNQDIALTLASPDSGTRIVTMTDAPFADPGVLLDTVIDRPDGKVGYLAYISANGNDVADWQASVDRFLDAGVSDLVVDLRYNIGGSVENVAAAGSLIGGRPLNGKVFAYLTPNQRTQQMLVAAGSTAEFQVPFVAPPSSLGLHRVYFLTTGATCSSAEMLINGMVPWLDVWQVGGTTCGKPYGFDEHTNCGTTYWIVALRDSNALHHGDFVDGLVPRCAGQDDFSHPLGDPAEGLFSAALAARETGQCPPAALAPPPGSEALLGGGSAPRRPSPAPRPSAAR
jgi:carboxyl-terminal processing protease